MESDDLSVGTSLPTDFSVSPGDSPDISPMTGHRLKKKTNRNVLDRTQLLHDVQLLKIELSQKELVIENLKADTSQRIEDLEERLNDALHAKQLLQTRLESQIRVQQQESASRQEKIQKELEIILRRQKQLEDANDKLREKTGDIRRSLRDLDISDTQYQQLITQNDDNMTLKEFLSVQLYERLKPVLTENDQLKQEMKTRKDELLKTKLQLEHCQEDVDVVKRRCSELKVKNERLMLSYSDTKSQVQQGDYKLENYDKLKRERDRLESELADVKERLGYLEIGHQGAIKDREALTTDLAAAQQNVVLLKQDKDYLSRQLADVTNKHLLNEDKLKDVTSQLERTKVSREELYEKYVASRDQYKLDYERKLKDEIDGIRSKTSEELDRVKTSTKEMYDRENRNLKDTRDLALAEKDRALTTAKDAEERYEELLQRFRKLQLDSDRAVTDMASDLKVRVFEAQRAQMVLDETAKNFSESQLEVEKLSKKLELLTKEHHGGQMAVERRVAELETELSEKRLKLDTYERLEKELDDVVMQTAEVEDERQAEKVLFSYGYGANVPTTTRRRLQQSMHLARRVLQLERGNTSLRHELERQEKRNKQLADEVKNANTLLDQAQQPYHYLVESIRLRDSQILSQKEHLLTMEEDLKKFKDENSSLTLTKNQLSSDLERLLNQQEEMQVLKQTIIGLSQYNRLDLDTQPSRQHLHKVGVERSGPDEENIHRPHDTQFTMAKDRS